MNLRESDGGGEAMHSGAPSCTADGGWVTSLDGPGLTGEDVIFGTDDLLLRERVGGNWTSQSGGSGWKNKTCKQRVIEVSCSDGTDRKPKGLRGYG